MIDTLVMVTDKNLITAIVIAQQLFASYFVLFYLMIYLQNMNRSQGKRGSGRLLPTNAMFQLSI